MAAATLRRRLGCRVTLIESHSMPGVGVGEATIPALVDWIENMGIDEDEFLRKTGGTYKLAIRFDNWVTPTHRYWHPFGRCGGRINGVDLIHYWQRGRHEGWIAPQTQYTDFSLQRELCQHGRSPRPLDGPPVIDNYAFHLDAGRLATFLRELATSEGVEHRVGDVTGAAVDDSGAIQHVCVRDAPPLVADVYFDCTGFRSVLVERTLQEPWVDWSGQLLCDRAVTVRTGRDCADGVAAAVLPYTISTGLSGGWAWQIPLAHADGAGYVYSSRHVDDEAARRELLEHLGVSADSPEADSLPTRVLPMRVGMRRRNWVRNCVCLGLSSGFVEPLESTGIFLIQRALDEWVEALGDADPARGREAFNQAMQAVYEEIRDFVLLHYIVSRRDDTSFWQDARSVELPDSLRAFLERYERTGELHQPSSAPAFAEANHHFIMAGADRLPPMPAAVDRRVAPHVTWAGAYRADAGAVAELLQTMTTQHARWTACLPPHQRVLQQIHRPESVLRKPAQTGMKRTANVASGPALVR